MILSLMVEKLPCADCMIAVRAIPFYAIARRPTQIWKGPDLSGWKFCAREKVMLPVRVRTTLRERDAIVDNGRNVLRKK